MGFRNHPPVLATSRNQPRYPSSAFHHSLRCHVAPRVTTPVDVPTVLRRWILNYYYIGYNKYEFGIKRKQSTDDVIQTYFLDALGLLM
jgi:hypothetical protein